MSTKHFCDACGRDTEGLHSKLVLHKDDSTYAGEAIACQNCDHLHTNFQLNLRKVAYALTRAMFSGRL